MNLLTVPLIVSLEEKLAAANWSRDDIESLCGMDLVRLRRLVKGYLVSSAKDYGLRPEESDLITLGSVTLGSYSNFEKQINRKGDRGLYHVHSLLKSCAFSPVRRDINLVGVHSSALGISSASRIPTIEELWGRAESIGLYPVPLEAVLMCFLKLRDEGVRVDGVYKFAPSDEPRGDDFGYRNELAGRPGYPVIPIIGSDPPEWREPRPIYMNNSTLGTVHNCPETWIFGRNP